MSDKKDFDLLNLAVVLVKWKRFLLSLFIITLVLSYLAIYFFIDEKVRLKQHHYYHHLHRKKTVQVVYYPA